MATLKDLEAAGYTVSESVTDVTGAVYYVSKEGVSLYLRASDQTMIDALVSPPPEPAPVPSASAGSLGAIAALDPKTATAADIVNAARGALTGAATTLPA